ncbi:MAG: carboxypeptidase-like regulatory domain-containing protein, partial [Thermoanaerobaculia bacterium]
EVGPPEVRSASSAPDGSFRIAPLQPGGLYTLMASRPGFAPATLPVAVPQTPRSRPPLRLVLTRGRTASGLVLDPRQRPVSGVEVKLTVEQPRSSSGTEPELGSFRAQTDAGGRFLIPGLPAGLLELRIQGPELAPLRTRVVSIPKGDGLLDLGTFTLEGRPRIAGWIVEPGGRPVEGVEIWVVDEDSTGTTQEARRAGPAAVTGPDGSFELRDRSVGDHEKLRACRQGFLPAEFQAQGPGATKPQVVLTPAVQLTGRVVSGDGEPLPGAHVSAAVSGPQGSDITYPDPPCPFADTATADAEGAFTLPLKRPGRYDVWAWGTGHLIPRLKHLLVPPEGLEGVEIRMESGATVTGHVINPEGHPVAGVMLTLSGPESYSKATTDDGGDFLLEGVGAGDLEIGIEHPDYVPAETRVQIPAQGKHLDITLLSPRRRQEIRGRVSDPDGAPILGAILSSGPQKTSSDADGSFVLLADRGDASLRVEKEGFAPASLHLEVKDRPIDGLEIRLGHGLSLTGRVLGVDPSTLTWGTVWVQINGTDWQLIEAPVDSEGRFRFSNLPPGEWDLAAAVGERSASVRFTPPAGQTEVMHDLEFDPVSQIRGRITGPQGEPIAGASVSIDREIGAKSHTESLADGSFEIDAQDGRHTLFIEAEGYSGQERPLAVAGAPVDVEIQLGAEVVLTGRLLGLERGDALKNFQVQGPPASLPGDWTVDQEGGYRQKGLGAGDWKVAATFLVGYLERYASGTVHIPAGATEATLDLDFHVGDLTLTLRPTTSEVYLDPSLDNADGTSLAVRQFSDDGTYVFPHLRAGSYRLSYMKKDKRQYEVVELTEDRELVIDPTP